MMALPSANGVYTQFRTDPLMVLIWPSHFRSRASAVYFRRVLLIVFLPSQVYSLLRDSTFPGEVQFARLSHKLVSVYLREPS